MEVTVIAAIILALATLTGGPQARHPAEDDARNEAIWSVAFALSNGMPDGMKVYGVPTHHQVFVGVAFPSSVTPCAIGSTWKRGQWSPVKWVCP
jgi:hypothetical protein